MNAAGRRASAHSRTPRLVTAAWALVLLLASGTGAAHVGSPDTVFAGAAGPWPVRVTIRPPGVVPGLAEIFVRVEAPSGGVRAVTVRPMSTGAGRRGAPAADAAAAVAGQPGLFAGSLWLMTEGEYAIEVVVAGAAGTGRVLVPVASIATRQLPMSSGLVILVAAFALILVAGGLAIVFAAVHEGTLHPGDVPGPGRRKRALTATAAAAFVFLAALFGERAWAIRVADLSRQGLYRPYRVRADVRREHSGRVLRMTVDDPRWGSEGWHPLLPDHGKLVHLFAMREPALDAFAHLHPVAVSDRAFETGLSSLPAGTYSLFADVTDETGLAETLVCRAQVPAPAAGDSAAFGDPDDSWRLAGPLPPLIGAVAASDLGDGLTMRWDGTGDAVAGSDRMLTFSVRDAAGRPAALQPYMGMLAHAAVMRDDGSVFVHLHPVGTASMASLAAVERAGGPSGKANVGANANANVSPVMEGMDHAAPAGGDGRVSLPYAFPKPGPYRLWVQVRTEGAIRTGVFDVLVR